MLNIEEPEETNEAYFIQKDLILKGVCYSLGILSFINLLRKQVAEINLLQLVPGFYLILLFFSFLLLVFFSNFLTRLPIKYDNYKSFGTRTTLKLQTGLLRKFNLLLSVGTLLLTISNLIPLSLDSFNSYGEKTLENLWSFNEVIGLEIILIITILILSQTPTITLYNFNFEKNLIILPKFWKNFSFIVFVFAGILTPTIDGFTQLGFSFTALLLSILIVSLIQKRIRIKFLGISFFGN